MNSRDFDNIIKEKASGHKAAVPTDVWENIAGKKKKRRPFVFWWIVLVLILGVTGIIWNTGNNKILVVPITLQKDTNEKGMANEKPNNETAAVIEPASNNKKENLVKTTIEPDCNSKTPNNAGRFLTKTVKSKTSIIIRHDADTVNTKNKKDVGWQATKKDIIDKKIDNNLENKYSKNRRKKGYVANAVIKISPIEIQDAVNDLVTDNHTVQHKNIKGKSKINIAEPTVEDSSTNDSIKTSEDINMDSIPPLKITGNDSLLAKNILKKPGDSSLKKAIVSTSTKKTNKKTVLKMEAGIIAVFPVQHSRQPLQVKRLSNTRAMRSEFISENIKTKMEAGGGLSVNLVKTFDKKWNIGGGLSYIRFTENLVIKGVDTHTNFTIIQRLDSNMNGAYLKADTVSSVTKDNTTLRGRNIYTNISIPLFVRYQLVNKKKWSCSLSTGLYIDLVRNYQNNIPGKFSVLYGSGNSVAVKNNSAGFEFFAGLHFSGMLYKKYEWFAATSFSYDLTAYKTNELSFNKKIHIPAISVGIAYPLKK